MHLRVAILVVSDRSSRGDREDSSGPALARRTAELGWEVVRQEIVPDEKKLVSEKISVWSDEHTTDIILTTGGARVAGADRAAKAGPAW